LIIPQFYFLFFIGLNKINGPCFWRLVMLWIKFYFIDIYHRETYSFLLAKAWLDCYPIFLFFSKLPNSHTHNFLARTVPHSRKKMQRMQKMWNSPLFYHFWASGGCFECGEGVRDVMEGDGEARQKWRIDGYAWRMWKRGYNQAT